MAVENVRIVYSIEEGNLDSLIAKFNTLTDSEKDQLRLMQQIDKQTTQTVNSQNNQYNGLNKTIGNIRNTIIAAFAVDRLLSFGKEVIEVTKRFESLNNSIKFASGSQLEYQKNTQFLTDVTKRLGIDLETASQGFKTVLASAKPAGINAEETRKIFEGVATAASAMGLSTEDAQSTFLALGQILSKGTVQAEELRGQIGERIPGAFNLAAQALGVTTQELNKMLEQGQVLSNDFVPKFAATLQSTFSPALKDSANSLQAISARADNAYKSLQLAFGAIGQEAYKGSLIVITNILEGLNKLVTGNQKVKSSTEANIEAVQNERKELNNLVKSIRDKNIGNETRLALVNELNTRFPQFAKSIDVVSASEQDLAKALKAANQQFDLQIFNISKKGLIDEYNKNVKDLTDLQLSYLKDLRKAEETNNNELARNAEKEIQIIEGKKKIYKDDLEARLTDLRDTLNRLGLTEKEANDLALKEQGNAAKDSQKADKKAAEELEKQRAQFALRELEAQQKLAIQNLQNQLENNNALLSNERLSASEKLAIIRESQAIELALIKLQQQTNLTQYEIDKNNQVVIKQQTESEKQIILQESQQKQIESERKTAKEIEKIQIETLLQRGITLQSFQSEIETRANELVKREEERQKNAAKKAIDLEEEKQKRIQQVKEKAFELGTNLVNFGFNIQKQAIDNEISAITAQKDYELQLAGNNEAKKLAISQNFAEKEKALKQQQARAEKDKAVFDILLNTSIAVVKALPNLPLSLLIGSIGALQLLSVRNTKIPKFRKGTEYLDLPKNGTDSDGMIIEAHKGERILPTHLNNQIRNIPNEMLPILVQKGLKNNGSGLTKKDLQEAFESAISKVPLQSINLNEQGFEKYVITANNQNKVLNKNNSW